MSKFAQAVVLLNMGGPNNLFEVETFLKNMFNDPLILDIKNKFTRNIVSSMIIKSRLNKAKKIYQQIGGKSPLCEITYSLTQKLQILDPNTYYTYAMRYTPPFSRFVLEDIKRQGIGKVVLFSMYPQYSKTTTLSSVRNVLESMCELNFTPILSVVSNYPNDDVFIEACVSEILKSGVESSEFTLLLSAHSLPQSMIDNGDPYEREVESSVEAIKLAMQNKGIKFKDIVLCYQSKLSPVKWLSPDTKEVIKRYKNQKVLVYPIAFSVDNSETIYELEIENRALAKSVGVSEYIVCKCPNDSDVFARAIIELIKTKQKVLNEKFF